MVAVVVERAVEAEDTPPVESCLRAAAPPALANSARRVGPAVLVTTATRLAMMLVLVLLWVCCGGSEAGLRKEQSEARA